MTGLEHGLPTVASVADPPDPELMYGRELLLVAPRDADGLGAHSSDCSPTARWPGASPTAGSGWCRAAGPGKP